MVGSRRSAGLVLPWKRCAPKTGENPGLNPGPTVYQLGECRAGFLVWKMQYMGISPLGQEELSKYTPAGLSARSHDIQYSAHDIQGPAAGPTPRCPGPCPGRLSQARTAGYSHRAHELGRSGHHHFENSLVFPKHILPDRLPAFPVWGNGWQRSEVCGGRGAGRSTGTTR